MNCTVFHCTKQSCTSLYFIKLHCMHFNIIHITTPHCIILQLTLSLLRKIIIHYTTYWHDSLYLYCAFTLPSKGYNTIYSESLKLCLEINYWEEIVRYKSISSLKRLEEINLNFHFFPVDTFVYRHWKHFTVGCHPSKYLHSPPCLR